MKLILTLRSVYGDEIFKVESHSEIPVDPEKGYHLSAVIPSVRDQAFKSLRDRLDEERFRYQGAPWYREPEDIFPFLRFEVELVP